MGSRIHRWFFGCGGVGLAGALKAQCVGRVSFGESAGAPGKVGWIKLIVNATRNILVNRERDLISESLKRQVSSHP